MELGTTSLQVVRTGTGGPDTFAGTAAADLFNGLAGADVVRGAAGADWLVGGAGADILNGGSDDDILLGGSEGDRFAFNSGAAFNSTQLGVDTIVDFRPAALDRLRLGRATFTVLPAGTRLTPSALATVTSDALAATSRAPIVYNSANGRLFYNPNGVAAGFSRTATGGGQFAQLWGASSGPPFPALSSGVFEIV